MFSSEEVCFAFDVGCGFGFGFGFECCVLAVFCVVLDGPVFIGALVFRDFIVVVVAVVVVLVLGWGAGCLLLLGLVLGMGLFLLLCKSHFQVVL
jgi:hypothetical protein